jgi:hypothetical protein
MESGAYFGTRDVAPVHKSLGLVTNQEGGSAAADPRLLTGGLCISFHFHCNLSI